MTSLPVFASEEKEATPMLTVTDGDRFLFGRIKVCSSMLFLILSDTIIAEVLPVSGKTIRNSSPPNLVIAMASVHPVSKKVNSCKHDEDDYRGPVFS